MAICLSQHYLIAKALNTRSQTVWPSSIFSPARFKAQLPMTIPMKELNGDEKFYDLPERLPTNASNPGTIQTGDLMLFGSNTLVLFYKTFSTSYSYTRLGRIDSPSTLAAALGSGNATVTFEL